MSDIFVNTLWMYLLAAVVSLAVAVVIKLIVYALGAIERKPAAGPAPAAARPLAPEMLDGVPADHVAAITAAVFAVVGEHRIVHIHDAHRHEGWVSEGRQSHHHSHSVGHHPRR